MTRTDLVVRAKEGDQEAFDALIATLIDRLYRVARLILRDVDGAEDAVQEALVRCWRDLPQLREPDQFDAWLNRILLNAVTDEARKRRQFASGVIALRLEPAQTDGLNGLADRDELARVFDRLSLDHRTIVVLHHYLGLTIEEAAAAIGIPVGTAKSRLHYALDALRAVLEADARSATAREALA